MKKYKHLVKDGPWSKEEIKKKINLRMKVGHKQTKCFAWGCTAGHLWRGKCSPALSAGGFSTYFAETGLSWAHVLDRSGEISAMTVILKEEDFGCLLDLNSRFRCSLLRLHPHISVTLRQPLFQQAGLQSE